MRGVPPKKLLTTEATNWVINQRLEGLLPQMVKNNRCLERIMRTQTRSDSRRDWGHVTLWHHESSVQAGAFSNLILNPSLWSLIISLDQLSDLRLISCQIQRAESLPLLCWTSAPVWQMKDGETQTLFQMIHPAIAAYAALPVGSSDFTISTAHFIYKQFISGAKRNNTICAEFHCMY